MNNDKDSTINITSYFQSGGITAQNVNVGLQPRHVGADTIRDITQHLPKDADVTVWCRLGDGEGHSFAHEILAWMRANGYENVKGITQALWNQPVVGNGIEKQDDGTYALIIGSHPGIQRSS
jgi:hypothetical protein